MCDLLERVGGATPGKAIAVWASLPQYLRLALAREMCLGFESFLTLEL